MKSVPCTDEICFADEIKSVRPDEVVLYLIAISPHKEGFIPSERTDLVKKKQPLSFRTKDALFYKRLFILNSA